MAHVHNEPADFYKEMTDGFVRAYSRYVERVPGASGVMRRGGPVAGKVSVVIGGGSGHYPAFCGTVGPGFADGAVLYQPPGLAPGRVEASLVADGQLDPVAPAGHHHLFGLAE